MGFRCSNVQVYTAGKSPELLRQTVIQAVRDFVLAGEFEELSDEAKSQADRSILIGPLTPEPWLSVFDQYSEENEEYLKELTAGLSRAIAGIALGISAFGELELQLYRAGLSVDSYSSQSVWQAYEAEEDRVEEEQLEAAEEALRLKTLQGQPELWQEILVAGKNPQDLRAVWQPLVPDQQRLLDLAALLQLNPDYCQTSYYHLDLEEEETPFTHLAFRSTRPSRQALDKEQPSGLPELVMNGGTSRLELSVGDSFDSSLLYLVNKGGLGKGLRVVVWGEALQQNLLEPETLKIYPPEFFQQMADPSQSKPVPVAIKLTASRAADDQKLCFVDLPDLEIPTGSIHPTVRGKVLAAGKAELHIGFAPLENLEAGRASWTIPITVFEQPQRKPAFSVERPELQSFLLRKLEKSDTLAALVVLAPNWQENTALIADSFERWDHLIGETLNSNAANGKQGVTTRKGGAKTYDIIQHGLDTRTEMFRIKVGQLGADKIWQKMRAGLQNYKMISANLMSPPDRSAAIPKMTEAGFAFDTNRFLAGEKSAEEPATHLSLWLDLKGLEASQEQTLNSLVVKLVDELMSGAGGLQAQIVRWDWTYIFPSQPNPYETVAGLNPQIISLKSWCSSYLRAVSEQLWLGSELLSKLEDRAALEKVAELVSLGDTVRLTLRAGVEMDQFEEALARIIPLRFSA